MWHMVATEYFKVRVPPDVKRRVAAAAERKFLTESAWLRGLVMRELESLEVVGGDDAVRLTVLASGSCPKRLKERAAPCGDRVHIRLRPDDRLLLEARANARGMRPATCVSVLTRSHLRHLAPLPKDELLAFRRSVAELAAIGRNVNQIARFAHEGGRLPPSLRQECWAMLKVCEALRDRTKALLMANLASWETGQARDA